MNKIHIRGIHEPLSVTSLTDLHEKVATLLKIPCGCPYQLYRGSEPVTEWHHVRRPIENGIPEIRCVIADVGIQTEVTSSTVCSENAPATVPFQQEGEHKVSQCTRVTTNVMFLRDALANLFRQNP